MTTNAFSASVETALLPVLFKGAPPPAPPTGHQLRLYSAAPSDTGGGTELSGGGYAPMPLAGLLSAPTPTAGVMRVSNTARILSAVATSGWALATHWGITDGSGSLLVWGAITSPKAITSGQKWAMLAGELKIDVGGTLTDTLRTSVLNWLFHGQAISPTTASQVALFDGTGVEISTVGTGYARQPLTLGTVTDKGDGSHALASTAEIDMVATATWGTVAYGAVMTATGTQLTYSPVDPAGAYGSGDIFHLDAGAVSLVLG